MAFGAHDARPEGACFSEDAGRGPEKVAIVLERLALLQRITARLSAAPGLRDVAAVALTESMTLLGASAAHLCSLEREELTLIDSLGYDEETLADWQRIPLRLRLPSTEAVRSCAPVWIESRQELATRFPEPIERIEDKAWAALPLLVEGRVVGTLGLSFTEDRTFLPDERAFLLTLTELCAQALQRARLYEAEHDARLAREEMLAIVSHDLCGPLAVLLLNAEQTLAMAPAGREGDALRRSATLSLRAGRGMERLIRDLLDASILEAGPLGVEHQDHDAVAIAAGALEMIAPSAAQRSIRIAQEIPAEAIRLACDRSRVEQVLSNLLGNALNFTPKGGVVSLRVEAAPDDVTFQVTDTGPGVGEQDLARLFDRYWTSRRKPGVHLGLGLFIAKGIVEAHGGTIRAAARAEGGSAFSFTLPRARRQSRPG